MKDKVCIRRRKPCTLRDLCRSCMCACTHIGLCFYVIVPIKIMGSKENYKTVSKCDRVSASLQSPPPPGPSCHWPTSSLTIEDCGQEEGYKNAALLAALMHTWYVLCFVTAAIHLALRLSFMKSACLIHFQQRYTNDSLAPHSWISGQLIQLFQWSMMISEQLSNITTIFT